MLRSRGSHLKDTGRILEGTLSQDMADTHCSRAPIWQVVLAWESLLPSFQSELGKRCISPSSFERRKPVVGNFEELPTLEFGQIPRIMDDVARRNSQTIVSTPSQHSKVISDTAVQARKRGMSAHCLKITWIRKRMVVSLPNSSESGSIKWYRCDKWIRCSMISV